MENYIWSLDISTTNIGMALWNSKGKLIELTHLSLTIDKKKNVSVEDRDIYKAEIFKNYVLEFKDRILNQLNGKIVNIIVEEPLGGSNNANTVSLLFGFNGICRYILHTIFNVYPKKISVYNSRKLFCTELVHPSRKRNKKTGLMEDSETLSFPLEYRKDKKVYIWEKVSKLEPQIEWFYKKDGKTPKGMCFDMSDAYVCGYSGMKQLGILK
ncbi:MAG: hypothetical protein PF487_00965 [Bacteroidales bacterium]|jgi:hypothetical protein|nr:hypothetical protein [Bacteroidales bacterium]